MFQKTVGIFLFPEVEVLDFAGPFEVFSVASRVALRDGIASDAPFRVVTLARSTAPLRARHGLHVVPDFTLKSHPNIDLLIVPGGVVAQPLGDEDALSWISSTAAQAEIAASVCTGAFLLAKIGLLDGLAATTHWEDIPELRSGFPSVSVVEDRPWVDQGRIVTSAGISAGIEMSLHLVARLLGKALARSTARQMQYTWAPDA
jgi:transcriptional regulator GlxA family with amidase domain